MQEKKVGHVTQHRYDGFVRRARELVGTMTSCQFEIGDMALKIEPIRDHPGGNAGIYATLRRFADDTDVEFTTLLHYREIASKWPKETRRKGASWTVYTRLAHLGDRRFETLKTRRTTNGPATTAGPRTSRHTRRGTCRETRSPPRRRSPRSTTLPETSR